MEELKLNEHPKKKIDTGLLVGLIAIGISIATLSVYIYQARIMQVQQHASVWPYVEWGTANVDGFYIEVFNKGIGPALIKKAAFRLDGKEVKNLDSLFDKLLGKDREKMSYVTSYIEGRVMAAGESFRPFQISDKRLGQKVDSAFYSRKTRLEICFCSIYNDCWINKGIGEVIEGDCK
jgi:hypothetical protein